MRYSDITEGGEVFAKSAGHVLAVIVACAPAVIGYWIAGEFTGDLDWIAAAGGLGISVYWIVGFFSYLGEQERHKRAIQEQYKSPALTQKVGKDLSQGLLEKQDPKVREELQKMFVKQSKPKKHSSA